MELSKEELQAKVIYLTQQLNVARDVILDYQLRAGEISLKSDDDA